jgi:hypothetical protein
MTTDRPKRLMKTVHFNVAVTVPQEMNLEMLTQDVRNGVGFGNPEVNISYVTSHAPYRPPPAIQDVPLPPDDETG